MLLRKRLPLARLILLLALSGGTSIAAPTEPDRIPSDPGKFDLYLLVGQSNMSGRGEVAPEDRLPVDRILVLNKEDVWKSQGEPIHFDRSIAGVGLGFTFARKMVEADPSITVGLIPCAVGGTPIKRWMPGGDLFENAVRRARIAQASGKLRAILWHQGEAESKNEERANKYSDNLTAVIDGFRRELNSPDLPVVVGEIGEFPGSNSKGRSAFAKVVNAQIQMTPTKVKWVAIVSSAGLTHIGDKLHFNSSSLKEFGVRYATALQELLQKKQSETLTAK